MELKSFSFDRISQLSERDIAYQNNDPKLRTFYKYTPEKASFKEAIANRRKSKMHRDVLHASVEEQYSQLEMSDLQREHIAKLQDENCFTVITAHQPSLMTGPLYYIYKVLSVINLAEQLNAEYPEVYVVPILISGGEDHDFEEINHLQIFNKEIVWETKHENESVGRMPIEGLDAVLEQLDEICREGGAGSALIAQCKGILSKANSYREFATRLANLLFNKYGLLVLSMDNLSMKSLLGDIIMDEVLYQTNKPLIEKVQKEIVAQGFDPQTHLRDINFFYFTEDNKRYRIEKDGDRFIIVDTDLSFSVEEMRAEITAHPERFSPNVNMRPIFQELVFPNLAYLGGGGELAYWLERKDQFEHHGISFPVLMRRNSVAVVNKGLQKSMEKLNLSLENLFSKKHEIVNAFLESTSGDAFSLAANIEQIESIFAEVKSKAEELDPTLGPRVEAEKTKSIKSIASLEGRLKKVIKQRAESSLGKIDKTYEALFPGESLQERKVNFLEFYDAMGETFIDGLKQYLDPFNKEFLFIHL